MAATLEGLKVETHAGAEGFAALEREWNGLEERASEDNIFLTFMWQHSWWTELARDADFELVAFRADRRLVGIAPMSREVVDGRHLVRFGGGLEVTDYLGLLVEAGFEDAVATAFLRHCLEDPEVSLDFHFLRGDGVTLASLRTAAQVLALQTAEEREEVSPRILLPADWDTYLLGLSKKDRHELRRKRRRLEAAGGWTISETTPATLLDDLGVFLDLHRRSTKAKADFLTPEVMGFFEHVAVHLQEAGWLVLRTLHCDGRPVAALLGFQYRNRLMLYNSGYDPEYMKLSVGFVLMSEQIRLAIEAGLEEVDFLRGDENYKYDLGAADVPLIHLVMTS